ncbi:FKBP-type peptidyl-prolyl cis-trans isomerase [Aeoliella mucimassa]|uniref:Peptidyl-prolyl cis-trans isomerase n=1 Tax=Aeoliella mucimassa TaxID=2527972 RepID=A0A518AUK5_9BACT|nr:FKBP-type peptidyl-prolyl cis-trans isomerase [Aeoliella mucimassa]QDU58411.1 putative FKBP-type peptidyl-prolyl cis-trans isomerase FkpA precursor [Aeoliella mucimassa]
MTRLLAALAVLVALPFAANAQDTLPPGQSPAPAENLTPEQFSQIVSYSLGRSIGQDAKMAGVKLDMRALQTGINEVEAGKPAQRSDEEMNQVMMVFAMRIQKQMAADNLKAGQEFLAKNAKDPAVKSTASGLQYKVLKPGTGKSPKATSVVVCHYHGTFINGAVFDSTQGGQPAQFPLNRVIPGWTEALQLMKEGAKYRIFVPSNLAYGENGRDGIGPNETLIFDIELLKVADGQLP